LALEEEIAEASARGSLYLFIGTASSTFISAISSIIFGRLLGPDGYGLYTLSLTPASFLMIASGFGINIGLVKYISTYHREERYGKIRALVAKGILFQLIISLILASSLYLYPGFFSRYIINRPEAQEYVRFTSILLISLILFNTLGRIMIGLNRMERLSLAMVTQSISKLLIGTGLLILGYGVYGAVVGYSTGYFIGMVVGAIMLIYLLKGRDEVDNDDDIGLTGLIKYGFPVYLGGVTVPLLGTYRNYLMSLYVSNTEIGWFRAAINLAAAMAIFINPITSTLFSSFSRLDKDRELHIIKELYRRSVKYVSIVLLPILLYLFVMARETLILLYGSGYAAAAPYVLLAGSPYLLIGLGYYILGSLLNGVGDTRVMLRIQIIAFITSVPLYMVLITMYGVAGILAAMLISSIAGLLYGLRHIVGKYGVDLGLGEISSIYVAAIVSAAIVYILKTVLRVSGLIYAITIYGLLFLVLYMVILAGVGGVTLGDLDTLERIFRRIGLFAYPITILIKVERYLLKLRSRA